MKALEIICARCGADTLLKREAVYEGLSKTGERLRCAACGFEYATEADVPFKDAPEAPRIFTDADRSAGLRVFDGSETRRLCRHCANYIVNPFTQFCAVRKREVQATDTCPDFAKGGECRPPPL